MPRKAKGSQGSWYAEIDGTKFPCVHSRFLDGLSYYDPVEGVPLPEDYVEAISDGLVILTKSKAIDGGGFKRSGYIALFRVADVDAADGKLRFRLAERVEELC